MVVIKIQANIVLGLLKTQGFNNNIHQDILGHLRASEPTNREKITHFCYQITAYLENLTLIQAKIHNNPETNLLCCSDIIESAFGKFKQKLNKRNAPVMSEFVFTIANFGNHFTALELENALEKVSLQTLKNWKSNNKNKRESRQKNT